MQIDIIRPASSTFKEHIESAGYEVREIAGKGKGVIAKKAIPKQSTIMVDGAI